ncbi:hypothetical protein D3C80_442520 [compost metagenome]
MEAEQPDRKRHEKGRACIDAQYSRISQRVPRRCLDQSTGYSESRAAKQAEQGARQAIVTNHYMINQLHIGREHCAERRPY